MIDFFLIFHICRCKDLKKNFLFFQSAIHTGNIKVSQYDFFVRSSFIIIIIITFFYYYNIP